MSAQLRSMTIARTLHGRLLLATGFALLTALGTMVQIPLYPVPITLQVPTLATSWLLSREISSA